MSAFNLEVPAATSLDEVDATTALPISNVSIKLSFSVPLVEPDNLTKQHEICGFADITISDVATSVSTLKTNVELHKLNLCHPSTNQIIVRYAS